MAKKLKASLNLLRRDVSSFRSYLLKFGIGQLLLDRLVRHGSRFHVPIVDREFIDMFKEPKFAGLVMIVL
jgi:hypothetical protein